MRLCSMPGYAAESSISMMMSASQYPLEAWSCWLQSRILMAVKLAKVGPAEAHMLQREVKRTSIASNFSIKCCLGSGCWASYG
ncbi:hypothetical protein ABBQ32_001545 [Trebouxia sp. C0010 RCD-2024]